MCQNKRGTKAVRICRISLFKLSIRTEADVYLPLLLLYFQLTSQISKVYAADTPGALRYPISRWGRIQYTRRVRTPPFSHRPSINQ
jgi:hypothetical protein